MKSSANPKTRSALSTWFLRVCLITPAVMGCLLASSGTAQQIGFIARHGGAERDTAFAVAHYGGHTYYAGTTTSPDFPATDGSVYRGDPGEVGDMFLVKMDSAGRILAATLLGGSGPDFANGLAITDGKAVTNATGEVTTPKQITLSGWTGSNDFPTRSPIQSALGGATDAVIAQYDLDLNLLFSSYLGGAGDDQFSGLAPLDNGEIAFFGFTTSTNFPFPTPNAANTADTVKNLASNADGLIVKLDVERRIPMATLLRRTSSGNGTQNEVILGGAYGITSSGFFGTEKAFYVTGWTDGDFFRHSSDRTGTGKRVFLTQISTSDGGRIYSRVLGGSGDDIGQAVAITQAGVVVFGQTSSTDLPDPQPLFQTGPGGGTDALLVAWQHLPAGGPLIARPPYVAYLGGSGDDAGRAIVAGLTTGNPTSRGLHFTGVTASTNLSLPSAPQNSPAHSQAGGGGTDGFFGRLSASASTDRFSGPAVILEARDLTYSGEPGEDAFTAIAAINEDGENFESVAVGATRENASGPASLHGVPKSDRLQENALAIQYLSAVASATPDLSIQIPPRAPLFPGREERIHLVVTNLGKAPARQILVRLRAIPDPTEPPAEIVRVEHAGSPLPEGPPGEYPLPGDLILQAGESISIEAVIRSLPPADALGQFAISAFVGNLVAEQILNNNLTVGVLQVLTPDLALRLLSASQDGAGPAPKFAEYQFEVRNVSVVAAPGAGFRVTPTNLEALSYSVDGGPLTEISSTPGTETDLPLGDIPAGATRLIRIRGRLVNPFNQGTGIDAQTLLSADKNLENHQVSASTEGSAGLPDLVVRQIDRAPLVHGHLEEIRFIIRNLGNVTARSVSLTVGSDASGQILRFRHDGQTRPAGEGFLGDEGPLSFHSLFFPTRPGGLTLDPNEEAEVVVTARSLPGALLITPPSMRVVAVVEASGPDANPANNRFDGRIPVRRPPDITSELIAATQDGPGISPKTASHRFLIRNQGAEDAQNVGVLISARNLGNASYRLEDSPAIPLPSDLDSRPEGVRVFIGDLAAGAERRLEVHGTLIRPLNEGTRATIEAQHPEDELVENNSATGETEGSGALPNLALAFRPRAPIDPAFAEVVTFDVFNRGIIPAASMQLILDPLPTTHPSLEIIRVVVRGRDLTRDPELGAYLLDGIVLQPGESLRVEVFLDATPSALTDRNPGVQLHAFAGEFLADAGFVDAQPADNEQTVLLPLNRSDVSVVLVERSHTASGEAIYEFLIRNVGGVSTPLAAIVRISGVNLREVEIHDGVSPTIRVPLLDRNGAVDVPIPFLDPRATRRLRLVGRLVADNGGTRVEVRALDPLDVNTENDFAFGEVPGNRDLPDLTLFQKDERLLRPRMDEFVNLVITNQGAGAATAIFVELSVPSSDTNRVAIGRVRHAGALLSRDPAHSERYPLPESVVLRQSETTEVEVELIQLDQALEETPGFLLETRTFAQVQNTPLDARPQDNRRLLDLRVRPLAPDIEIKLTNTSLDGPRAAFEYRIRNLGDASARGVVVSLVGYNLAEVEYHLNGRLAGNFGDLDFYRDRRFGIGDVSVGGVVELRVVGTLVRTLEGSRLTVATITPLDFNLENDHAIGMTSGSGSDYAASITDVRHRLEGTGIGGRMYQTTVADVTLQLPAGGTVEGVPRATVTLRHAGRPSGLRLLPAAAASLVQASSVDATTTELSIPASAFFLDPAAPGRGRIQLEVQDNLGLPSASDNHLFQISVAGDGQDPARPNNFDTRTSSLATKGVLSVSRISHAFRTLRTPDGQIVVVLSQRIRIGNSGPGMLSDVEVVLGNRSRMSDQGARIHEPARVVSSTAAGVTLRSRGSEGSGQDEVVSIRTLASGTDVVVEFYDRLPTSRLGNGEVATPPEVGGRALIVPHDGDLTPNAPGGQTDHDNSLGYHENVIRIPFEQQPDLAVQVASQSVDAEVVDGARRMVRNTELIVANVGSAEAVGVVLRLESHGVEQEGTLRDGDTMAPIPSSPEGPDTPPIRLVPLGRFPPGKVQRIRLQDLISQPNRNDLLTLSAKVTHDSFDRNLANNSITREIEYREFQSTLDYSVFIREQVIDSLEGGVPIVRTRVELTASGTQLSQALPDYLLRVRHGGFPLRLTFVNKSSGQSIPVGSIDCTEPTPETTTCRIPYLVARDHFLVFEDEIANPKQAAVLEVITTIEGDGEPPNGGNNRASRSINYSPNPPRLEFAFDRDTGVLRLQWAGPYLLSRAVRPDGPYQPIQGASSPFILRIVEGTDPTSFFLLSPP